MRAFITVLLALCQIWRDTPAPLSYDEINKQIARLGDSPAEIDRKIQIIDKDGEHWDIERWKRILTSDSPRIDWKPIRRKRR